MSVEIVVVLIWFVFIGSIVHAARRNRWGWVVFLVLMPPIAILLYWALGSRTKPQPPQPA